MGAVLGENYKFRSARPQCRQQIAILLEAMT